MDKFYLIAIMLFAIQRDMVDLPITFVLNCIDRDRGILSRNDFLELEYADAMTVHFVHGWSFGIYDKYLEDEQFSKPALPF